MPDANERFLSTEEAANYLAVSVPFLYKWRHAIPHYRVGGAKTGKLLWKPSELSAWAESRRVQPVAEAAP